MNKTRQADFYFCSYCTGLFAQPVDMCTLIVCKSTLRPCAFFSMFLVTFFSPNLRERAEKKQNAQRKKKHWLSVPDYLTDK